MTGTTELPRWNLDPILPAVGTESFAVTFARAIEAARDLTRFFDDRGIGGGVPGTISAPDFELVFSRYLDVRAQIRLIEGCLECLTCADTRDAAGQRPLYAGRRKFQDDPHWRDLILFHEYFNGDTGEGLGASHQTGWTALVTRCLDELARSRADRPALRARPRR